MAEMSMLRGQDIRGFIDSCVNEEKGGSLYVCGSPGIGKSLLMENILDEIKQEQGVVASRRVFHVEENQAGAAERDDPSEESGCAGDDV